MTKALLRLAREEDLPALAALARSSFTSAFAAVNTEEDMAAYLEQAFAPEVLAREFADPDSYFTVVTDGAELLGYCKLRRNSAEPCIKAERNMELERLYTASNAVGKGIGSLLMEQAIDTARSEGNEVLWLGVWEDNHGAIRFYERHGFADVGSHAFMLGTDRQIDRIMQLLLP